MADRWVNLDEHCKVLAEPYLGGVSIVINSIGGRGSRRILGMARLLRALVDENIPIQAIGYHPKGGVFKAVPSPSVPTIQDAENAARSICTDVGRIPGANNGSRLRVVVSSRTVDELTSVLSGLSLAAAAEHPPEPSTSTGQVGNERSITHPLNLVLHGPPGTGKTWAMRKMREDFALDADGEASGESGSTNQFFVTLHPSFTYEDFVEGIHPESSENGEGGVRYPLRAGIFKQACERAVQLAEFEGGLAEFCELPPAERREALDSAPPCVLFIDEINRGNVARILGELITLIEPDKRLGADQELIVTLPGSRQRFGVPSNLWIIGTMNTADRSVVALDTALRRRFAFRECPPDPELLAGVVVEGVDLRRVLQAINQRLLSLRDRDHLIGHAFFMPMRESVALRTISELRRVFHESVLPLLIEYFHDDLGRVGLVLGAAFVKRQPAADVFAKNFEHEHREDLADRTNWKIEDVYNLEAAAFLSIYE